MIAAGCHGFYQIDDRPIVRLSADVYDHGFIKQSFASRKQAGVKRMPSLGTVT
jgi:hypothetical protein